MRFHLVSARNGFTLIELLVSVAIIGVLSAILYGNFTESRAQTRDKQRMVALKEAQLAIEQYRAQNGRYPAKPAVCPTTSATNIFGCGPGPDVLSNHFPCNATTPGDLTCEYIVGLVPEYISKLPTDPNKEQTTNAGYYYFTNPDGSAYKLMIRNAVESVVVTPAHEFAPCPSTTSCVSADSAYAASFGVYSPGAEQW